MSAAEAWDFVRALARSAAVERAGREAVSQLRARRMARLLAAAARVPLYRERLQEAGVPLRDALEQGTSSMSGPGESDAWLAAMRPMTKAELVERLDESFADPALSRAQLLDFVRAPERAGELLRGRYLVATTSGTTGEVGLFVHDLPGWALTRGVTFARIYRDHLHLEGALRLAAQRRYRMAFVVAAGGHYMTYLLASRLPRASRRVVDARVHSVESSIEVLVSQLNAQRPHLLHGYPTVLELLCWQRRSGALRIEPDMITAGSEPLTPSCRAAVAAAFPRAQLVETYAATECVPMATSCRLGHLHLNEDACVVEPVDDQGQAVPEGQLGARVWVTNLLNLAQPIVRYELSDQVRLIASPCLCGSPFARLEVQGRSDDTFWLRAADGGWQAHPPIPLELIFLRVRGLLQYQLVHVHQNHLEVRFVPEPGVDATLLAADLRSGLSGYLRSYRLDDSVSVSLRCMTAIQRPAGSQKIRQICSLVPPPDARTNVRRNPASVPA